MPDKEFNGTWIQAPKNDYGLSDKNYYFQNPNPIFRQIFEITNVKKSLLKIASLGYYIVHINGLRVGNFELNSDWSDYSKRIYFDEYDITQLLKKGTNIIEVELGNGMYNPAPLRLFGKYNLRERLPRIGEPKFVLDVLAEDKVILRTDQNWSVYSGRLKTNNLYLGEHVDFSKSLSNAKKVISLPLDNVDQENMKRSFIPKIKKLKNVEPVNILTVKNDILIDFGETISGFLHLQINGHDGQKILLKYCETMKNGKLLFNTSFAGNIGEIPQIDGGPGAPKKAIQQDIIDCKNGTQIFENKFTFHSFRYVLISGLDRKQLSDIKAIYVHTDLQQIGQMNTDDKFYNQLLDAGIRTKLNNVHSVFEDCARERLEYGGDIVALANSNLYSFDLKNFYKKIIDDFVIEQTDNGGIPETAPYMGIQTNGTGQGEGPILWQLVLPYLLWKHYQFYGDKLLLEKYYRYAKKQYDYLSNIPIEDLANDCIGDHGSILVKSFYDKTPDKLLVGYCTILSFDILMERLACILSRESDAKQIKANKINLIQEIERKFTNSDGTLGQNTQTGLAFSLLLGLGNKKVLLHSLIEKIKADDYVFTAGIYGMAVLYRVLHENHCDAIVSKWLKQRSKIGFYSMLKNDNKVLSELFVEKHSSANHAMFSSYIQWYYEALGGIQISDESIGCSDLIINPFFDKDISNFDCQLKTISGIVKTSWQRSKKGINFCLEIPKNISYQVDFDKSSQPNLIQKENKGEKIIVRYFITE
ncbi:alpha-L-rhamnosidase [Companilactobacillus suantsaicola]|uniref:alpha-L-rhamnosidase n=1 Tax=Companilactobacillus suantsaicola TaxID=2487723 RepID=A0A4Z0JNT5_9LACO|nr:family 78 glycoside hydrolase catalytic domain [Companilactobacillus suantsaicola]TGD24630.1 alpha-L-rhamnosidase [Companilactobacillus suantsaicola]